jgi:hypothetical protein
MADLQQGMQDAGDVDDSMAYDIADGVLATEDGLEDYLRDTLNISDPIGYIANYIF